MCLVCGVFRNEELCLKEITKCYYTPLNNEMNIWKCGFNLEMMFVK